MLHFLIGLNPRVYIRTILYSAGIHSALAGPFFLWIHRNDLGAQYANVTVDPHVILGIKPSLGSRVALTAIVISILDDGCPHW